MTVTEGKTSLAARGSEGGLPNEALTFSVEAKSTGGGGGNYTVNFGEGSWTVGDVTVTANKTGQQTLSESDEITLTNFNAETMEVKVSASGGFNKTLTVTEGKTSLATRDSEGGLPNEALTFSVEAKSTGGDPNPTPTNAISFALEGDAIPNATVEYSTYSGSSWSEWTAISGTSKVLDANVDSAQIRVSGTGIDITSSDIPGTSGSVMEIGTAYTVTEKKQYHIQIDKSVCTVTWAYNNSLGEDALVEHGTVKIISAVKDGGDTWSGIEPALPGANNNQQDANGGRVAIIPGSVVTVEIVPDYKYQFVAGTLNGQAFAADDNKVSTFTFTMPSAKLHLSALFTPSLDKTVIGSGTGVTGATISGGENVISSGNLELTVTNSTISDADKDKLQASSAASGVSVDKWLEVDLQQVVNKGKEDKYWTTDKEELSAKITITLYVGTGLSTAKEYVVVREHKGVYEQIPATYDPEAGTLTFESDKFSEYAVGTVVSADNVLDTINDNWTGTGSDAGNTVTTLTSTYTVQEIASAVKDSLETVGMMLLNKLQSLENDYASEKTIRIEPALIESAVSSSVRGAVTVTGAAFNAADNSSIQLVIGDKSGTGITIGSTYSKSVQLDMRLVQTKNSTSSDITTLTMPVTIIMQVPAGINASRLVILHDIDGDGTSDETVPYYLIRNEVTFTVTHFSNFAFAEKAVSSGGDVTTGGNTGSNTSGSSSNTSSGTQSHSVSTTVKAETVSVPVEYIVVRGDTLGRIARRNNMTLSALLALNPQIKNPNLIYPGQKIILGYTNQTVTDQATTTTDANAEYYIVQKGDFLYRIARKNKLTLAQLAAWNPEIMKQKYIYPGQKVRVK